MSRVTAPEPRSAAHPDDEKPAPRPAKVLPGDPDPEPRKPAPPKVETPKVETPKK